MTPSVTVERVTMPGLVVLGETATLLPEQVSVWDSVQPIGRAFDPNLQGV